VRAPLRAAVLAAGIVAADQVTKALARGAVARGDSEAVLPGVELVNTRNTGVAFGLFSGGGVVVTLITLVALAGLLAFFSRNLDRPLAWLPTGLLLGGALGNAVDRIREGAVVDFVKLPSFPAFNVADTSITFGVLALLWVVERSDRAERRAAQEREGTGREAERPA
jgi:signal peptidase II